MTTTKLRSQSILSRRNYLPRTAGYLFGFVPISTIFYLQHVGFSYWLFAISTCFLWPHIAFFIGINSYNSKKTEFRILILDSMLIGMILPMISFNVLPSATFFIMQSLNTMGAGGLRLCLKGVISFIFGVLILIPLIGIHLNLETNIIIIVSCIPALISYPLTISFLGYLTSLKLNKTRGKLKSQKEELEDAYAEIETALQETKAKEQEITNINQVVQTINSTLDLDAVIESVANALQQNFSFNQIAIMLIDKQKEELFFEKPYGEGFTADQVEKCKKVKFPLKRETSMCCNAALKNKLFYIPDITPEMVDLFLPADKQVLKITHCKSYLFCPMEFQKKVIGVMVFGDNRQSFKLTEADLDKIQRHVNQIASAINNARLFKESNGAKQIAEAANNELEKLSLKLSKYLSPQVYLSIFSGQKDVKIEAYRKKLTIFFSDIKDFTEITDSMESEAITTILNNYFTEMSEIALKHGGTIDKFIGDAIMIFFGDPDTRGEKDDALSCVLMAIEMRDRMKELQKKWDEQGISKPFRIRIGINTGYCTVGNFGSDNRLDYTIIGGQVNLTSRLESHAGTVQILISHETYALVKDQVACKKKDQIKVKGIAYPIQTYQVIRQHDNTGLDEMVYKKEESGFKVSIDFSKKSKKQVIESLKNTISDLEMEKIKFENYKN